MHRISFHKRIEVSQNSDKGGGRMKERRFLFSILTIIIIGLLVVSCTTQRTPEDTTPQRDNRQTRFLPETSPVPQNTVNPNTTIPGQENRDRTGNNTLRPDNDTNQMGANVQDRAKKLAEAATKQKEVKSASCLITGDTAMVGLQFNKQYEGELTDTIKEQVDRRVREADNMIDRVIVTADPDIVSRIEEIVQETGKGRPISGFTKELNEMINRINPK